MPNLNYKLDTTDINNIFMKQSEKLLIPMKFLKPLAGTLWGLGYSLQGGLGDGTTIAKSSPVQIGALTDWATISNGTAHTAAIKTDGTLWTWGNNGSGQLGDGGNITKSSPIQIGALVNWTKISAGVGHMLARRY